MIINSHMHIIYEKEKHSDSEDNFFCFVESIIQKMKENSISGGILAQGIPLDLLDKILKKYSNWFKGLIPISDDMDLNKKNIEDFLITLTL